MADEIARDLGGGHRMSHAVVSIDFASTALGALSAAIDLDWPASAGGARPGSDVVLVFPVGAPLATGLFVKGYVDDTNSLKIQLDNVGGANPTNLAAAFFHVFVIGADPVGGPL